MGCPVAVRGSGFQLAADGGSVFIVVAHGRLTSELRDRAPCTGWVPFVGCSVVRRRNILCSQNAAHIQKATPSFLYFVR